MWYDGRLFSRTTMEIFDSNHRLKFDIVGASIDMYFCVTFPHDYVFLWSRRVSGPKAHMAQCAWRCVFFFCLCNHLSVHLDAAGLRLKPSMCQILPTASWRPTTSRHVNCFFFFGPQYQVQVFHGWRPCADPLPWATDRGEMRSSRPFGAGDCNSHGHESQNTHGSLLARLLAFGWPLHEIAEDTGPWIVLAGHPALNAHSSANISTTCSCPQIYDLGEICIPYTLNNPCFVSFAAFFAWGFLWEIQQSQKGGYSSMCRLDRQTCIYTTHIYSLYILNIIKSIKLVIKYVYVHVHSSIWLNLMIFPQPPIFWHVSWSAPTPITKTTCFCHRNQGHLVITAAITKKVLVVSPGKTRGPTFP